MPSWRQILGCVALIAALSLLAPTVALASGPGNSAGDQQYIDPLGGGSTHSGSGSGSGSKTTQTSPPPTTTSAPITTSSAPATSSPATSTPAPSASATGASTTASTPTSITATADPSSTATLPRTGFDTWLAVAIGVGLLGSGLGLRRVLRDH